MNLNGVSALANAAALAILVAFPASAATIVASPSGVANPAVTLTFEEVNPGVGSLVTNQYGNLGVTFSPGLKYSSQTGFPNIEGATLGNFSPYITGPYVLNFSAVQSSAAFALVSNNTEYLFESLLNGQTLESFTAPVGFGSSSNFYGFTGSQFDSIRITSLSNDFLLLDNLQFDGTVMSAVPEPSTWAMMLLGFGLVGGALRSAKRKRPMAFSKA